MESTKKMVLKNNVSGIIRGLLVSISISLIAILVFAVFLRFVSLPDIVIKIINQVIKVLSILFGVKATLKKDKSKGLIKGIASGVLYTITSYLVFSVLIASFNFGLSFLYDIIFSALVGLICGVIFVNAKR